MLEKIFKKKYKVTSENLAVPEIHTDRAKINEEKDEEKEIEYDNLAMPEIHLPHHENKENE